MLELCWAGLLLELQCYWEVCHCICSHRQVEQGMEYHILLELYHDCVLPKILKLIFLQRRYIRLKRKKKKKKKTCLKSCFINREKFIRVNSNKK